MSPLPYYICPFLRSLQSNPNIRGIGAARREYKMVAYMEDLPFFLSDPLISLPNFLNRTKILWLTLEPKNQLLQILCPQCLSSPRDGGSLPLSHPLHIAEQSHRLFWHLSLLKTLQQDLTYCNKSCCSWFGRAATLKMTIFPRILYIMQTIPIKLYIFLLAYARPSAPSFGNQKTDKKVWPTYHSPKTVMA